MRLAVKDSNLRRFSRTLILKHEGQGVAVVLALQGDGIVAARALEHLGHRSHVNAQRQTAIAAEVIKTIVANHERN